MEVNNLRNIIFNRCTNSSLVRFSHGSIYKKYGMQVAWRISAVNDRLVSLAVQSTPTGHTHKGQQDGQAGYNSFTHLLTFSISYHMFYHDASLDDRLPGIGINEQITEWPDNGRC
jgi:hypothetical protein